MMRKKVYSDILPHFVHCLTKNLPRRFLDPLSISFSRSFISAETYPGTKNAKHLVPTREKPKKARLGKKRKIPGEARDFGCLIGMSPTTLTLRKVQ
jgi:hypothetical protein